MVDAVDHDSSFSGFPSVMAPPSMDSASSSVKAPKRPGYGSRHGTSWINRLHHHHDRKHRPQEREPLLADDQTDSDLEAQENPHQAQPQYRGCCSAIRPWFDEADKAFKKSGKAVSRNWKQILIACGLTLLTVLFSLLFGFYLNHKGHDNMSISVCTSAACVHAASGILYNLDPAYAQIAHFSDPSNTPSASSFDSVAKDLSTDACTDFNKLVCGGFDQYHDLRPDQSDMFTGTLMVEDSQTILRHILEGDASKISSADRPNFEKLKNDYDACMDEETIKDQGLEPLKKVTEHIKALFATSEEAWKASPARSHHTQQGIAYTSTTKLTDALLYMQKLGTDGLVSTGIGVSSSPTKSLTVPRSVPPLHSHCFFLLQCFFSLRYQNTDNVIQADDKDPDTQVLFISPPRLGLPSKEYYEDKGILADYQEMAAKVMGHFYQPPSGNTTVATINGKRLSSVASSDIAKDVVSFETKIAALTPPEEDMNDITKTYNPMTLDEVAKVLPQVSFENIIKELAPTDYSTDRVIVTSPAYLEGLSNLLSSASSETVPASLVWKTIQRYASRIEDHALKPLKQFDNVLQGKDPDAVPERWRTCIRAVDGDLGWILSKFFVDSAFSPAAKQFGDQIVTDIKDSFVDFLGDATWMTEEVRERSVKKVQMHIDTYS